MITVRKSKERRFISTENQRTWMTFDFENSNDPLQNGFGALKIFNEQVIIPSRAFVLHTHKDMVIVTYVHEGVIIYNGPLEKGSLLNAGHFQLLGVSADAKEQKFDTSLGDAHVFQSGFTPGATVLEPKERKKLFTLAERTGILKLIASPDGKDSSLKINQDVRMYSTLIQKGNHVIHELGHNRSAWLHVVKGRILLDGLQLQVGDGVGFFDEPAVSFTAQEPSEILLFDLAVQETEIGSSAPLPTIPGQNESGNN